MGTGYFPDSDWENSTWLSRGYLVGVTVAVGLACVLPQISGACFEPLRVFLH